MDVERDEDTNEIKIGDDNVVQKIIMPILPQKYSDPITSASIGWSCEYTFRYFAGAGDNSDYDDYDSGVSQVLTGETYKSEVNAGNYTISNEGKIILDKDVYKRYKSTSFNESNFPEYNNFLFYTDQDKIDYAKENSPQYYDSWNYTVKQDYIAKINYDAYNLSGTFWTAFTLSGADSTIERAGRYDEQTDTSDLEDNDNQYGSVLFRDGDVPRRDSNDMNECYNYIVWVNETPGFADFMTQTDHILGGFYSYDALHKYLGNTFLSNPDADDTSLSSYSYYSLTAMNPNTTTYDFIGGRIIVSYLMQTFMHSDTAEIQDLIEKADYTTIKVKKYIDDKNKIEYTAFISSLLNLGTLLLLAMTTLDIALRVVKIGFLQILSPIAIITYAVEKNYSDSKLKRWTDEYVKTYADLFLRLALIYFITLILDILMTSIANGVEFSLINIFILVGALMFMKQAPKLLGELLNIKALADGGFTLNPMKKLRDIPLVGKATALGLGGLGGAFQGITKGGMLKGALRGGITGAKSVPFNGLDPKQKYANGRSSFNVGQDAVLQKATGKGDAKAGFFPKMEKRLDAAINNRYMGEKSLRRQTKEARANSASASSAQTAAATAAGAASTRRQAATTAAATARSNLTASLNARTAATGAVNTARATTTRSSNAAATAATTTSAARATLSNTQASVARATANLATMQARESSAVTNMQSARTTRDNLQTQLTEAARTYSDEQNRTRELATQITQQQAELRNAEKLDDKDPTKERKINEANSKLMDLDMENREQQDREREARDNFNNVYAQYISANRELGDRYNEVQEARRDVQQANDELRDKQLFELYDQMAVDDAEAVQQDAEEDALVDFNAQQAAIENQANAEEDALEDFNAQRQADTDLQDAKDREDEAKAEKDAADKAAKDAAETLKKLEDKKKIEYY